MTANGILISKDKPKIESLIESRNTSKGNPNAILIFGEALNTRQQNLIGKLKIYDDRVVTRECSH